MGKNIIDNQELFFDMHAEFAQWHQRDDIFYIYANQLAINGFTWIEQGKNILDYGCGEGNTLEVFLLNRNRKEYNFYGVDMSANAIKAISAKYPEYKFYKIVNNKIPQIPDSFLDAACLNYVLHHSDEHEAIIREIYSKLAPSGKFLIIDLTSNNPFLRLGLFLFRFMPMFLKNKFSDDLIIDGKLPEKFKVDKETILKLLNKNGFSIVEIDYGHLFFILFCWLERFIPLSRFNFVLNVYKKLIKFEQYLLRFKFFQKRAELFYIKCEKCYKPSQNKRNKIIEHPS